MVKWRTDARSANVEDRRGSRIPGGAAGGIGGIGLIIVLAIALFTGMDPGALLQNTDVLTGPTGQSSMTAEELQEQEELANLSAQVLGSTESVWSQIFREDLRRTYNPSGMVLYSGLVESACGQASASTGPFYCPGDKKVYLDLDFFQDLATRYGAPGDFAPAYVIAHEVGHHVQTELGTLQYAQAAQRQAASQAEANEISVALELQADCYAGIWTNRATEQNLILEPGDIEEGLNAASSVGDDRLQQQAQGYVVPDSFTHGSSAQRVSAFQKGLQSGEIGVCDCAELPPVQ